jgi:hypothetical protein
MKKIFFAILLSALLTLSALNFDVQAGTVPTIHIQGVTKGEKVTVSTKYFPANKIFVARMGEIGTRGINGIVVGSVDSGLGGSLKFTFEIPSDLSTNAQISIRLDSTTGGYYSYNWFYNTTFGSHDGGILADEETPIPTISVLSVEKETSVKIKGTGFPLDESITVMMGELDTKGKDGTVVDTFELTSEQSFEKTFDIPEDLKKEEEIAIRFESEDSDLVLYTEFKNASSGSGGTGGVYDEVYTGIPTITIESVVEDEEVTLKVNNFPANKEFKVLMGNMGTRGIGGLLITTFDSGIGGSFTKTFTIPEDLKGKYQIAIRLQTADNYFYAYNWFYNNTSDGQVPSGYSGIPTFSITAVKSDETVTIKTNNFPKDYDFKVYMGKKGTQGIGGINVTTVDSAAGGTLSYTFDIPEDLAGEDIIAIRLVATSGGFYAYNWFYNTTYP